MLVYDASQSAMADKLKLYINGVLASSDYTSSSTAPTTHVMSPNKSGMNQIIGNNSSNDGKANLLIADAYFLDGVAKTVTDGVTDFTELNSFGGLQPKKYTGTDFGNNGFHIDAQPAHDADLLVTSVARNDGDTLFADYAGNTLTKAGDTEHRIKVGNPFTGDDRSIYFDGYNDMVAVTTGHSDFAFGTGDFTVEGWYNFESLPSSTDAMLVDFRPSNNNDTDTFAFSTDTTNGVKVYSGGDYALGGSLSTNTWHHIALVRDSGTLYAYIDGTATGTTQSFSNNLTENSTPRLGATADGASSAAFTGYIFDVRITKGTARYTANFTPPTSKLETEDSDTKLLIQPHKDDTDFHDETSNSHALSVTEISARTASTPYDAEAKSTAIYFDGTGDNLVVTSDSSFNEFGTGDFTIEMWVNPTDQGSGSFAQMFELWDSSSDRMYLRVERQSSQNVYKFVVNGSDDFDVESDSAPDYGNWQHLAVVRNGTSITMYVDGTAQTDSVTIPSSASYSWPSKNLKIAKGNSSIGSNADYKGYIFDYRITKGTAQYTSNFTVPSAPFELTPVYIGGDQSGNKNNFEPTNLDSTDIREDNPFKNHATWNPLIKRSSTPNIFTYSEGNTVATYTGGVAHTSTTVASSGVHYAEFAFSKTGSSGSGTSSISGAGVVRARWNGGNADSYAHTYNGCYYGSSGTVRSPDASHSVAAVGSNRLGIAFDGANNKADFYSVTSSGAMTLLKSLTSSDSIDFDGSATFTATSHDGGIDQITGYFEAGEWWGTAPAIGSTTATSLNTSNLDAPIVPSENFDILTYTGNSDLVNASGSTQNVTGVNFDVGMAWIKDRDNRASDSYTGNMEEYGHYLFDTITGTSTGGYNIDYDVASGMDGAELNSGYYGVTSFSAGSGTNRGITVDEAGETNFKYDDGFESYTERYVAWLWRLGSTGDSSSWNSSYTAPTTEHYNESAGVTTINVAPTSSGDLEVAHSLSAAPEFFFVTSDMYAENFSGYYAFHKNLSSGNYLYLDGTSAQASDTTIFPSGAAHADYIKLGSTFTDEMGDGFNLRIWAFTGVEGYSKFGTYEGNGLTDGPFVYTGFRPRWIMVKPIDDNYAWYMHDTARSPYNYSDNELVANTSGAEYSVSGAGAGERFDILSNGFKHRTSNLAMNANNKTMVYAAFGEAPFAKSNAR
tara:strand:- start:8075 stop:11608 length:3534 start_codon:yes stop_codon:yes gene_type:complete